MYKTNSFFHKNKISLIIALLLMLINILAIFPFGLHNFSFVALKLNLTEVIISSAFCIFYIAFCIFMQIKKYSKLAKGLFFYQMVGFISYVLYFLFFIFNISSKSFFYLIFHAWTLPLEPIAVFLGRISGIEAKYIVALIYLIITFITGKTVIAIRKNIAYEKQYKEDHNNNM